MWLFYYFKFEINYDVLKPKSPCFLLNKNANVNKNGTESKTGKSHSRFYRPNLVFHLISWNKIVMRRSSRKIKMWLFCSMFFTLCLMPAIISEKRLQHRCFLVDFLKFLRAPLLRQSTCMRRLLTVVMQRDWK